MSAKFTRGLVFAAALGLSTLVAPLALAGIQTGSVLADGTGPCISIQLLDGGVCTTTPQTVSITSVSVGDQVQAVLTSRN